MTTKFKKKKFLNGLLREELFSASLNSNLNSEMGFIWREFELTFVLQDPWSVQPSPASLESSSTTSSTETGSGTRTAVGLQASPLSSSTRSGASSCLASCVTTLTTSRTSKCTLWSCPTTKSTHVFPASPVFCRDSIFRNGAMQPTTPHLPALSTMGLERSR